MTDYWAQFSKDEIDEMHGALDDEEEEDLEEDLEEEEKEESCPRCSNGCNYCLML